MVEFQTTFRPVAPVRYTMLIIGMPFISCGLYAIFLAKEYLAGAALMMMGVFFWQFVASLRIKLTKDWLEYRQFGLVRWRVRRGDVELKEGRSGDLGGFPALLVFSKSTKARMGAISRMQFRASDLDLLRASLQA
jgi:hypothetical protein